MKILTTLIALGIAAMLFAGYVFLNSEKTHAPSVTTFEECVDAGYPVLESYPEQCRTPDGKSFTREIGNELEQHDMIRASNPRPNQTISGDVEVTGEARGTWFFEASFPIWLQDSEGNVISGTVAQAEGEWMTEDFVRFGASLSIPETFTGAAELVFEKDNPSGLPENADELRVPVTVN